MLEGDVRIEYGGSKDQIYVIRGGVTVLILARQDSENVALKWQISIADVAEGKTISAIGMLCQSCKVIYCNIFRCWCYTCFR